eukprot:639468-Amphidinium_carterae.1
MRRKSDDFSMNGIGLVKMVDHAYTANVCPSIAAAMYLMYDQQTTANISCYLLEMITNDQQLSTG